MTEKRNLDMAEAISAALNDEDGYCVYNYDRSVYRG